MKIIRKDFPWFVNNPGVTYLDSGATSLKPQKVIDAVTRYLSTESYNTHNTDSIETYKNKQVYLETKKLIAEYFGTEPLNIVFTSGATHSLNIIALGLQHIFKENDEIIISTLEHSSNILPFIEISKKTQAKIKYIDSKKLMLSEDEILNSITKNTRLISFTNSSNLIGQKIDAESISKKIKEINPNTLICIDATQYVTTKKMNLKESSIDFAVCSAHKMFGPTGIGMLYVSPLISNEIRPVIVGGGMNISVCKFDYEALKTIEKLEAGTLNIEGVYGWKAALEYYKTFNQDAELERICDLKDYLEEKLNLMKMTTVLNKGVRSNILIFSFKKINSQDFAHYLDTRKIIVRSGLSCAKLIHENIKTNDVIRISFHFYSSKEDVDVLIKAIEEFQPGDEFNKIF